MRGFRAQGEDAADAGPCSHTHKKYISLGSDYFLGRGMSCAFRSFLTLWLPHALQGPAHNKPSPSKNISPLGPPLPFNWINHPLFFFKKRNSYSQEPWKIRNSDGMLIRSIPPDNLTKMAAADWVSPFGVGCKRLDLRRLNEAKWKRLLTDDHAGDPVAGRLCHRCRTSKAARRCACVRGWAGCTIWWIGGCRTCRWTASWAGRRVRGP